LNNEIARVKIKPCNTFFDINIKLNVKQDGSFLIPSVI
jgi:hypothetical protein